ncbi:MAG: hypothetical protein KKD38_05720, partial [Candidatus Delongbacteria bacterium]|nr:hypothetical protein [Candidatus Delongbacteria bacterium]
YLSIIAGRIFIKNIAAVEVGIREGIKFTYDLERLEEIENTEIALKLQENISKQVAEMEYDITLENQGEKILIEVPYGENRFEFTEKCIKLFSQ